MPSVAIDKKEYVKRLGDLMALYQPAEPFVRMDEMRKLQSALARMQYFHVTRAETSFKNEPMIEIKARYYVSRRVTELVMLDLETIWQEVVGKAEMPCHCFVLTSAGFEARLALARPPSYVTIAVQADGVR